ncbi:MAG: 50S ribosomal protein L30 [Dehalococcoidia bacterium]|jgi:large subunit ribosomal protein L30|tara:strand:- start:973 stop:1182 length:210 start_codon:yes stop_codon:yes gene_type:complete
MSKIKITLVRSTIGLPQNQRRIVKALGFRKLNQNVIHESSPTINGMVHKVKHLVSIEDIAATDKKKGDS